MGFVQRALALEIERHVQNGLDFLLREIEIADAVTAMKIGLHCFFSYWVRGKLTTNNLRHEDRKWFVNLRPFVSWWLGV